MAIQLCATRCCGMYEIDNLSHCQTPQEAMTALAARLHMFRPAFVVFSGVVVRRVQDHASGRADNYGQAFADYVLKNGLGQITTSPQDRNINSGNDIQIWVWNLNRETLKVWMESNKFTYSEEFGWQTPQV